MSASFRVDRRTQDGLHIDGGVIDIHRLIIELRPRWIDDVTVQVALCELNHWRVRSNCKMTPNEVGRHKYDAYVNKICPAFEAALAWTRSRRMGVKYVVEQDAPLIPEFVEWAERNEPGLHQWLQDGIRPEHRDRPANDLPYRPSPPRTASHRLVFKRPNDAFEFTIRWL